MPLYEYLCKTCGHRFEVIQKFSDALVRKCPKCGKAVEKLISSPAVQFKGTGWYVTDYGRKSPPPGRSNVPEVKQPETANSTDESAPAGSGKAKEDGSPKSSPSPSRK